MTRVPRGPVWCRSVCSSVAARVLVVRGIVFWSVAEEHMVRAVQAALDHHGIGDTIHEVGQFMPRGASGSIFAGGLIGSELGGAVGLAAGTLGGWPRIGVTWDAATDARRCLGLSGIRLPDARRRPTQGTP